MGKIKLIKVTIKYHASSGPDQGSKDMELLVSEHSIVGMSKKDNKYEIYLTKECISSLGIANITVENVTKNFKDEDLEIL